MEWLEKHFTAREELGKETPLLYYLDADLLQSILNKAAQLGFLRLPIPAPSLDFPIIQYAGDTLIVLEASTTQLFFLKGVFQSFSDSISLKINFSKSMMVPINLNNEKLDHLARPLAVRLVLSPSHI